jgi:hypothetical protein
MEEAKARPVNPSLALLNIYDIQGNAKKRSAGGLPYWIEGFEKGVQSIQ